MKIIILFASISIASGLLLVNIYTSLVDAKSWGADIPKSLLTAKEYFKTVSPANFFRMFSPVNQVLGLLALIVWWKSSPPSRLYLAVAFALYVLGDVFTFAYFYPRNHMMFGPAAQTDAAVLKKAWSEWSGMNWVRSLIVLAGLIFSFVSLHKVYALK